MADHTILIKVDLQTREFSYTNLAHGADATTIILAKGDRVLWVLDQSLPDTTFQVDFGSLNPFSLGKPQSFRGANFAMSAAVKLPPVWLQNNNPVFEYSVTLANGWRDDPHCMVVPEPTDPTLFVERLAVTPDFTMKWHDANEDAIDLSPTDLSVHTGAHGTRAVIFQWAAGEQDTQPFNLVFTGAPAGWPTGELLDNNTGLIAPSLPPGPETGFVITTRSADQVKDPSANGTLTVTKQQRERGH